MSPKAPIGYIDIRVFAHATEDSDKVLTAARNIIPPGLADTVAFNKKDLTGHHGNPITLFEARLKEKNLVNAVFEKLCTGLSMLDKKVLTDEINRRLDKGNLYMRLDKQSAYLNEFKLGSTDPIHMRIHFKRHDAEGVFDSCRKFGLLP